MLSRQSSDAARQDFGACMLIVLAMASACGGTGASDLPAVVAPAPAEGTPTGTPARPDPVTATCEVLTVAAGTPVREGAPHLCDSGYLVDFSVETNRLEAVLMDAFDLHPISDWRVARTADRIRHDFRVHWAPYRNDLSPFRRMTIEACPGDDDGPLLACSDVSCDLYEDPAQIPPLTLPDTVVAFHHERKFLDPLKLKEGDEVDFQIRYEIFRSAAWDSVTLTPDYWTRNPVWELEFTPRWHEVALSGAGSGTVRFKLRVLEDERSGIPSREHRVRFYVGTGGEDGCVGAPADILVIVEDAE